MRFTIQTVDFKENRSLNKLITAKASKLEAKHPEIIGIDVSLKIGAAHNINNKWCSIHVSHAGENQFVKKNSTTFEESVQLAVAAIDMVLSKRKTKRINMRNDVQLKK